MATIEGGTKQAKEAAEWAVGATPQLQLVLNFVSIILVIGGHVLTAGQSHPWLGALLLACGLVLFLASGAGTGTFAEKAHDATPIETHRPLVAGRRWRFALTLNSIVLGAAAYWAFADNRLDRGFWLWIAAILYFGAAMAEQPRGVLRRRLARWRQPAVRRAAILLIVVTLIAVFFRTFRLVATPVDMTSDHAEKLLDVYDVLAGSRPIFFPRNTGREAFQFYLTAALVQWTPLTISHLALKVGTVLFGIATVPATYFLGKEMYGRQVGLLAAFLLAISHWHVAITRVGLRFPFTAAFAAPALFFLLRALRRNRRNDWLAAGAFLGLGLHTYTAMRIVPLLFILLVTIRVGSDVARYAGSLRYGKRIARDRFLTLRLAFWKNAVTGGALTGLLFLPLLRYMSDNPAQFWYRAASRAQEGLTPLELWLTFWGNVKNALLMFNYRGDVVPMNTVPEAAVLGPVTGGLFILGIGVLLYQLVTRRTRMSLYLLTSLLVLLLPSILSLAFPGENPSVVRAGGAIPIVMIVAAAPLSYIVESVGRRQELWVRFGASTLVLTLLAGALLYNYTWYFENYDENVRRSIWNATEMGAVLQAFEARGGNLENAYHVAYPHWVDTRNIGINAGAVTWQNAVIDLAQVKAHAQIPGSKIYIVYPAHEEAIKVLRSTYPRGLMRLHTTERPGKQFLVFEVPAADG